MLKDGKCSEGCYKSNDQINHPVADRPQLGVCSHSQYRRWDRLQSVIAVTMRDYYWYPNVPSIQNQYVDTEYQYHVTLESDEEVATCADWHVRAVVYYLMPVAAAGGVRFLHHLHVGA